MTETPPPSTRVVRYRAEAGVATITLDRPTARNALNSALVAEVDAALNRIPTSRRSC